jgi:hypothetical protein
MYPYIPSPEQAAVSNAKVMQERDELVRKISKRRSTPTNPDMIADGMGYTNDNRNVRPVQQILAELEAQGKSIVGVENQIDTNLEA